MPRIALVIGTILIASAIVTQLAHDVRLNAHRKDLITPLDVPLSIRSRAVRTPVFVTGSGAVYQIALHYRQEDEAHLPSAPRYCANLAPSSPPAASAMIVDWTIVGTNVHASGNSSPGHCSLGGGVDVILGEFRGAPRREQRLLLSFHDVRAYSPPTPRIVVSIDPLSSELGTGQYILSFVVMAVGIILCLPSLFAGLVWLARKP